MWAITRYPYIKVGKLQSKFEIMVGRVKKDDDGPDGGEHSQAGAGVPCTTLSFSQPRHPLSSQVPSYVLVPLQPLKWSLSLTLSLRCAQA